MCLNWIAPGEASKSNDTSAQPSGLAGVAGAKNKRDIKNVDPSLDNERLFLKY